VLRISNPKNHVDERDSDASKAPADGAASRDGRPKGGARGGGLGRYVSVPPHLNPKAHVGIKLTEVFVRTRKKRFIDLALLKHNQ